MDNVLFTGTDDLELTRSRELVTERELAFIAAKVEFGNGTVKKEDAIKLLDHIEILEELLDEGDLDDCFGTEGWRHRIGFN